MLCPAEKATLIPFAPIGPTAPVADICWAHMDRSRPTAKGRVLLAPEGGLAAIES
jgi:hypothetical protein